MTRFQSGYAKLVARLVADLVLVSREVVAEEREKLLAARKAEQKAERKKAPRVSPRLQRALERAEAERQRAAERRALRAQARAAKPEKRRPELASSALGRVRATPSTVTQALPPPLFVHKRSRDGSIQRLERAEGETAPPPA